MSETEIIHMVVGIVHRMGDTFLLLHCCVISFFNFVYLFVYSFPFFSIFILHTIVCICTRLLCICFLFQTSRICCPARQKSYNVNSFFYFILFHEHMFHSVFKRISIPTIQRIVLWHTAYI